MTDTKSPGAAAASPSPGPPPPSTAWMPGSAACCSSTSCASGATSISSTWRAGAQRAAVPGRAGRGRPGAAAAGELCAGRGSPRRPASPWISEEAAVRRRRPARRPRSGDRRLQGRQRDRRRHARRASLLLRGLPARAGARADDRGHHGGRGRVPRAGDRAAPRRRRQAGGDRQLPGRLGDRCWWPRPGPSCSARSSSPARPCPTGPACTARTRCAIPAGSMAAAG